jgi:hypothetical protein
VAVVVSIEVVVVVVLVVVEAMLEVVDMVISRIKPRTNFLLVNYVAGLTI